MSLTKSERTERARLRRLANPEREKAWQKAHYWRNREKRLNQAAVHALKRRQEIAKIKDVPCMDCGGRFPGVCMEFDHVRGTKLFSIGIRVSYKMETVLAEISKCDIVCANCHKIRTSKRRRERGIRAVS